MYIPSLVYNLVPNQVACVAGRRKGGESKWVRGREAREGEGTACKDVIVFFVFFVIGHQPVIQNHKGLFIFIFNKADKSRHCFKLILKEILRSLEENGIKFMLKAKQKKAIERFYEKQIF